jgi:ferric-dicitrate binding protein FerR (iron transport regulator)
MLADHDADPRWVPLQVTHEAVALAHSLLHGWQVQQAMPQGCLTQWQQTLETLETMGVALQHHAETHQAQTRQRRRALWWALLAGVCLMALVAGWLGTRHTAPPPYDGPTWQTLQPVPSVPETVRPSDEPPARRPTRH